jgi:hypothetical protein
MRRCQFAVKPMRGLRAADRRRIGPKWKAVLRSTETAGVSVQRPCRRRAGPCSGSPPSSRARSNQKTARSTIALTCRNRSWRLSWWHGCSPGIHSGSHDGMMPRLHALTLSASPGSWKSPMRSAGPASIKAVRPAHVWYFPQCSTGCVARACVRFPTVAKENSLSFFAQSIT